MERPYFTRLVKLDTESNLFRYYVMRVTKNLFGEWTVLREWGRIGRGGQVKIDCCGSLEEAERVFDRVRRQKLRRGYGELTMSNE